MGTAVARPGPGGSRGHRDRVCHGARQGLRPGRPGSAWQAQPASAAATEAGRAAGSDPLRHGVRVSATVTVPVGLGLSVAGAASGGRCRQSRSRELTQWPARAGT